MKKITFFLIAIIAFATISFSQTNYPFKVGITGDGKTPIILIPGFSCSGDVWKETLKVLEPKYKCYTLTMAGFTGVKPDTAPNIKNWISGIAKYIEDEKLVKPIIIGHSIGGVMSEILAADYPNLISKIIVVDAVPCLFALSDSTYKAYEHPDCSFMVNYYKFYDTDKFRASQKLAVTGLVKDSTKIDMITEWAVNSDRKTLGEIFCQFRNTDIRSKISQIVCPALILLEPSFKGNAAINKQYENLKTAKFEYANKGLHFIMYDDTDWYLKEISSFLGN